MSVFANARKCDLIILAEELGEVVNDEYKISDLKRIILASKEYDEESAKEWLKTIIIERKEKVEFEERRRKEEFEERRRQDEIEERRRKEEQELRKFEMDFELQKLRIEAECRSTNFVANPNVSSTPMKSKLEIHHLMPKFNPDENDISLYLIMFERLAKQADIIENTWVTHLLGLLPYDVAQLIARETEEIANDYKEVKKILLKRYKLTPEKFRQKFFMHSKNVGSTWKNFAYELRSFFNEWINGVKVDTFEKLSDIIIADQIKRKVSEEVKDHFIDVWSKLINPDELVEKLDDYDTLRSTFKNKQPRKEVYYEKKNTFKEIPISTNNEKRKLYSVTQNENGEPKCFNCNNFGHIAKDCMLPKPVITCRKCNKTGHKAKNCFATAENSKSNDKSLAVSQTDSTEETSSYLKSAKLNNGQEVQALIDTGSSCCLLKFSVAQKFELKIEPAVNELYGFGSQKVPAVTTIGRIEADIEVDNVTGQSIIVYIVPDSAQPVDLVIGRTWLDLPYIAYARIGKRFHIGYCKEEPFSNFLIDEKVDRIRLKVLETTELENNTVNLVRSQAENIDNGLIVIENHSEELGCILEVKDGKTCVPLANIGDKSVEVFKGQCVGRAEVIQLCPDAEVKTNPPSFLNYNNFEEKVSIKLTEIKIDSNVTNEQLHDCSFFTTLDLAHGYLQIPQEAKLKTAFITPDDTGQFERMIFGLTNAPAEFQRPKRTVYRPRRYEDFMLN